MLISLEMFRRITSIWVPFMGTSQSHYYPHVRGNVQRTWSGIPCSPRHPPLRSYHLCFNSYARTKSRSKTPPWSCPSSTIPTIPWPLTFSLINATCSHIKVQSDTSLPSQWGIDYPTLIHNGNYHILIGNDNSMQFLTTKPLGPSPTAGLPAQNLPFHLPFNNNPVSFSSLVVFPQGISLVSKQARAI